MNLYAISELTDKEQIRAYLTTDRDYAAYALGDLEPPYAQRCTWIATARTGAVEGLALIYTGLDPTVLFLMGTQPALNALLLHGVGPDKVFFNIRPEIKGLLETYYEIEHLAAMYRMRVTSFTFQPMPDYRASPFLPRLLDESHTPDMLALIQEAARHDQRDLRDVAFIPDMVPGGYYHGIYQDGQLVAMAGTHLIARETHLAAVGNVVVHPAHRGRRLGTRVSHAVTQALIDSGITLIVLNVRQDNTPAIKTYARLGYKRVCEFLEGIATRR